MNSTIKNLKEQIEQSITLDRETPKGFQACYCPVCNDHTKRAGFKFEEDKIIYHCFRGKCNASCGFTIGEFLNKKFKTLMETLGVKIPIEAYQTNNQVQQKVEIDHSLFKPHTYEPYTKTHTHEQSVEASSALFKRRNVASIYQQKDIIYSNYSCFHHYIFCYLDSILIGVICYYNDSNYSKQTNNTHLIFVPDGVIPDEPIIVEGVFDALCIPNAVAILGDHISPQQAYFLRNKDPIFLPDRGNNRFFEQAKQYNWRISVPLWDEKDVNEHVGKYGLLNAVMRIKQNIYTDINLAELVMRFYQ